MVGKGRSWPSNEVRPPDISRRLLLKFLGVAAGTLAPAGKFTAFASRFQDPSKPLPNFTGPGPNPYWNSLGPYVAYSQKAPLVLLTDRPVQLETPRHFFLTPFTPNTAFYVRWHLDELPAAVDLAEWRLHVAGNVEIGRASCRKECRL